jgi:hypothetical protein
MQHAPPPRVEPKKFKKGGGRISILPVAHSRIIAAPPCGQTPPCGFCPTPQNGARYPCVPEIPLKAACFEEKIYHEVEEVEEVEEKGEKKKNRGVARSLSQSWRDWLVEFSKQILS